MKLVRYILASPLFRQVGVYAASHLASKLIPFLLLPVLTRYLSPADYGIVAMFLLSVTLLEPFITLALDGVVTVRYSDEAFDLPRYVGTGFLVMVMIGSGVELLVILLGGPMSDATSVPSLWLYLVVPFILCRGVFNVQMALWRVQQKAARYGIFQNLQSAAILGGAIAFVVVFGWHWKGRIEAEMLAMALSALIALWLLHRSGSMRLTYVKDHARHLMRFGLPLIPHSLGAVLIAQTDRVMLTNLVGVEETGLYSVGFLLASVIELVNVSFNNAYVPWLYKQLRKDDPAVRLRLVRFTYLGFVGAVVLAGLVGLLMPWFVGAFLDPKFAASARYVRWCAVGFSFSGMYYLVTNYIFFSEKTGYLALVTFVVALANIPLSYTLIKLNGAIGAAQSTACALGLSFLLTWLVSSRAYPMPWLAPFRRPPP